MKNIYYNTHSRQQGQLFHTKIGGLTSGASRGEPPSVYMGNLRSTEQAENFKYSETWLYLFKIMKKTQKPIFSAIHANVQKLFQPQNVEILTFFRKWQFS